MSRSGHIVVCGYEPGGQLLLDALLDELGPDREIVLFGPGERPREVPPHFHWLRGDPTKESELGRIDLADADALVVVGARTALPQLADARTILVVFTARRYLRGHDTGRQRPVYVVAEILDAENMDHAETAGADEVVETRRIGFQLLAQAVREPGATALVSELADITSHGLHVGACPTSGRYAEVVSGLLASHGVAVFGVRNEEGRDVIAPQADLHVTSSCGLLYVATDPVLPPPPLSRR